MSETNFPDIPDPTLRKFADSLIYCLRRRDGSLPNAAPNAFTDRLQTPVPTWVPEGSQVPKGREVAIEFRINPDGISAWGKVQAKTPRGVETIEGEVDIYELSTKLAP